MVSWREIQAWSVCLGGRIDPVWKNNFDDSKAVVGWTCSDLENNFKIFLCCLISFAFSNCLNLSCSRAIKE
jgi:hypothetical protein